MSFGFQFEEDELDEEYRNVTISHDESQDTLPKDTSTSSATGVKAKKHTLSELLSTLPPRLSYSRLKIALKDSDLILYKRDLFDARFQLIHDAKDDAAEEARINDQEPGVESRAGSCDDAEQFYADTDTDLIPGVYEGGFKTWECAIDLVGHLADEIASKDDSPLLKECRVVELGCGTALPSLYLFSRMLSFKEQQSNSTFNLCDYNEQVLRLVSLHKFECERHYSSSILSLSGDAS